MFIPMKISGKEISIRPQPRGLNRVSNKPASRSLSHMKNSSVQLQSSPSKKVKHSELKVIKQKPKKTQTKAKEGKSDKKKKENQQSEKKQKKKKTTYINLKELKPLNLEKQKQFFFEKDCEYDPFFLYPNISDLNDEEYKDIKKYDTPDQSYLPIALAILEKAKKLNIAHKLTKSAPLTELETSLEFDRYIKDLEIGDLISYAFAENTIAPTSVVHNNQECNSKIMIGLPIHYRPETVEGVMNHEIGTHFLRKCNDRTQKWYKDRKKYGMGPFLKTQEGLAALNQILSYLPEGKIQPLLYRPALMYYSCYLASKNSFSRMYQELSKYEPNSEYRWRACVRVKRGIADTSKPCGMYKDQIYFVGAIQILKNRRNLDFVSLHCGKMNVEDCLRLTEKGLINTKEKIRLPLFLKDMKYYLKCLDQIAEFNQIP